MVMPDERTLKWQIQKRSEILNVLLELHGLIGSEKESKAKMGIAKRRMLSLLVGSAFSLWRAVFLVYGSRNDRNMIEHCYNFSGSVLRDNAITFAQDRDTHEWSVGYYLNNAAFRIIAVYENAEFKGLERLDGYVKEYRKGLPWKDSMHLWDDTHSALRDTIDCFKKVAVGRGRKNRTLKARY
jgi:hypothetical protein